LRRLAQAGFAAVLGLSGCSLFGDSQTPHQQFLEALAHRNNAEANQIWLKMTPDDRANLAHSAGIKPSVSPADVEQQLMNKTSGADDDVPQADDNQ
jgi:hypothetical protein